MIVFGGCSFDARAEVWSLSLAPAGAWTRLEAGVGPAARTDHSAIYDPAGQRMIVFGGRSGCNSGAPLNDVWALSLSGTPAWSEIVPTGTPPAERFGHTAVYDAVGHRMLVFGGVLASSALTSETWALSLTGAPSWEFLTPDPGPAPRWMHAAIYDPLRNRMLIHGGWTGSDPVLGDIWELSLGATSVWSAVFATGTAPAIRRHRAIYDPVGDRLIIPANDASFDVWALSLAGPPSWSTLAAQGEPPTRRALYSAILDASGPRIVVHGGESPRSGEAFELSLSGPPTWGRLGDPMGQPNPRTDHTATYDPVRRRMIVIGGDTGAFVDPPGLWALDLDDPPLWRRTIPAGSAPTPRVRHSSIYDPVRDRLIVFAGTSRTVTDAVNHTWALDMSGPPAWFQLAPAGTPPDPRSGHAAIYDPVRDRMVVFGGTDVGGIQLNDVWALTLTPPMSWSPLAPTGTPPTARSGMLAIYDPVDDGLVIFGGLTAGGTPSAETWTLALGAAPAWTLLTPSGPAPTLGFPGGFYDPQRHRVVVMGDSASNASDLMDDVRALQLGPSPQWSVLTPGGSLPMARTRVPACLDPGQDRMMVFAGGVLNDTWQLAFGAPLAPSADCPEDVTWTQGEVLSLSYVVSNPFAFAQEADVSVGSERNWPGLPAVGHITLAAGSADTIMIDIPVPDTAAAGLNTIALRSTLRSIPIAARCDHHLHDATTPVELSFVRSAAGPGEVVLTWFCPGCAGGALEVERREPDAPWARVGWAPIDGLGYGTFRDADVVAGRRYGYRVRPVGGVLGGEAWVDLPTVPAFGLQHVAYDASTGELVVAFSLPREGSARLVVFDVAGRRVHGETTSATAGGAFTRRIDARSFAPGIYVARLSQAGEAMSARVVVRR
jgi:hypothetical protein